MGTASKECDSTFEAGLKLVPLPFPVVGYLINSPRRFHSHWLYCSVWNDTDEPLFVYGPHHASELPCFPCSLYLLPPHRRTPRFWDCKGILIPMNRSATIRNQTIPGPVALKYRDLRRVRVNCADGVYKCPKPNKVFTGASGALPVPGLGFAELLAWMKA